MKSTVLTVRTGGLIGAINEYKKRVKGVKLPVKRGLS